MFKAKPIYIICKWVYYMDEPFTNGKGRGYNAQNLLKKNGIDFELSLIHISEPTRPY